MDIESISPIWFCGGFIAGVIARMAVDEFRRNLAIKRKIEKAKPRIWVVPEIHTEELLALWMRWDKEDDLVARYQFWKEIDVLFPDTPDGPLHVNLDDALTIKIVEGEDDE